MLSLGQHIDYHRYSRDSQPQLYNSPHPPTFSTFATNNIHTLPSTLPSSTADASSRQRTTPSTTSGVYMSSPAYSFAGPAIRVQHSTPTPQPPVSYSQEQGFPQHTNNWLYGTENGQSGPGFQNNLRGHHRAASSSSAGSHSPASSFGQATSAMYSAQSPALSKVDSSPYSHTADEAVSRMYPNHLPTPNHTPTQDTFLVSSSNTSSYPQFANLDSTMASHMAMKQAFADEDDAPGFSHSTRHSVSSFGRNSPATPRTISGDDFDEGFKMPSTDLAVRPVQAALPKLDRTITDVYSDELYNPTSMPSSTPKKNTNYQTLLSPYHNVMMNERLQQANQARSHSPIAQGSRGVSPFRQGSPYAQSMNTFASPQSRLSAGAQLRQKQKSEAEAAALSRRSMGEQDGEPKTISPKDAVLEYHEDDDASKMPLFSDTDSAQFGAYGGGFGQPMVSKSDNSYGSLTAGGAVNGWANPTGANAAASYSATSTATPSQAPFTFAPSSVPGIFHSLPTSTYGTSSMVAHSEETPEFPAHLTSMESSVSEAPPHSSQNSNGTEPLRPASTLADTGTYTCTYHGCTQRFETPQKLQRHKREAHRQNNNSSNLSSSPTSLHHHSSSSPTPGIGSGMTSAALAARNSQAGPHKCERINPTTGKPCNTIFSRPYDLTRHEDTIHNVRKQKVRCALCQEEKTFSRNDALTRHMRVVHPDVDFPGKHRKRGGHSDD